MIQILQVIFSLIGCMAIIVFLVLFFIEAKRHHKETNEYKFLRDKDTETIMTLTKEKENLKEEITTKLSLLTNKEEERQNLLIDILHRLEDKEKGREEDLMNWLEFKAKKWQDQIDDRINERINRFQNDFFDLKKKLAKIEEKLELMDEEKSTKVQKE